MTFPKFPVRFLFLLTATAGTLFLVLSSDASAHQNTVSLSSVCTNGTHHARVTVSNDSDHNETATLSGATSGTLAIPAHQSRFKDFDLPGTQQGTITVTVTGLWSDGFTRAPVSASTTLSSGCVPPTTTTLPVPTTTGPVSCLATTCPPLRPVELVPPVTVVRVQPVGFTG